MYKNRYAIFTHDDYLPLLLVLRLIALLYKMGQMMAVLSMQTRFANNIAKFGKIEKKKDEYVRKSRLKTIYAVFADINIQPIKIL